MLCLLAYSTCCILSCLSALPLCWWFVLTAELFEMHSFVKFVQRDTQMLQNDTYIIII